MAAELAVAPPPRARTPRRVPAHATRRPHIAFLGSRGIPARYGGFETFVEQVSTRLVELGIDVTVFCEGSGEGAPRAFGGVQLEYVRAWAPGPLRTLQFDAQCLARARKRFDVVYMLGYGASLFCALPRLAGRDVWINMDGLEWRRSKWNALARAWLWAMERAAAHTATRLVYDNAALRDEVSARTRRGVPSTVLEYGAPLYVRDDETEALSPFGLVPGGYRIAVARLEPENHLVEIARAQLASESALPLAIVTNLELGGDYARAVQRLAGPRVKLLGSVYDPRVLQPLRRHAHAYVHGHSVGGTNPSLLEALGCASLVLAHANPFNRETLAGEALFWRDEAELTRAIVASERLPAPERERLRQAGFARARDHYSWERIARAYAELVRESCS